MDQKALRAVNQHIQMIKLCPLSVFNMCFTCDFLTQNCTTAEVKNLNEKH